MVCEHTPEISVDHLMGELRQLDALCSAVGDSDATGKLRGKLSRLHASIKSFQATGDLSAFREDLRCATTFVEHLHSRDPLALLLERFRALDRHMAEGDSHG